MCTCIPLIRLRSWYTYTHTCIHKHILTNTSTVHTPQLYDFVGTASPQCVYLCFTAASKFEFADLWEKNRQVYACMMHECM